MQGASVERYDYARRNGLVERLAMAQEDTHLIAFSEGRYGDAAAIAQDTSSADGLAFAAPPLVKSGEVDDADLDDVCAVLGINRSAIVDAAWADNGPGWVAVRLVDAEAVLALKPNMAARSAYTIGVVGTHPTGSTAAIEVRALFKLGDSHGSEDPVTGSLNASIAQWLLGDGTLASPYVAAQGTAIGRSGRVHVDEADDEVWVGGDSVTCIDGTVNL